MKAFIIAVLLFPAVSSAADTSRCVVLMVWDGLRPDLVTETNTPTLFKLSREGVFFTRNHAVYPSSTEVNGTALATGDFPAVDGILANWEYRPEINPRKAVATEALSTVRGIDKSTGGKYIPVPTLAETVQAAGWPTAVAGTKGVVLLHDRAVDRTSEAARKSLVLFAGRTIPEELGKSIAEALGPFPQPITIPNRKQDEWTTQALINVLWKNEVPRFSLLWVSDPDFSQHHSAPGDPEALAALKSSDDNLASVLAALDAKGVRASTDIFIVSDHGFSTAVDLPDMKAELVNGGFDAVPELSLTPKQGRILVVNLGGSVMFYVTGHDAGVVGQLVEFLKRAPYTGVIFTREKTPGAFTLDTVRANTPGAPDVLMAFHWTSAANAFGVPGLITGSSGNNVGKGTHTSLSKYDLHNTLIAAGPDLKHGFEDKLPSGNTDVAPTILAILGISPLQPQQGRVLSEALANSTEPTPKEERTLISTPSGTDGDSRSQYVRISRVGSAIYLDEGNSGSPGE